MLAGILALFRSGSLIRPIAEVAAHARRIGGGDLGSKITIKGKDEIAGQSDDITAMAIHLQPDDNKRAISYFLTFP